MFTTTNNDDDQQSEDNQINDNYSQICLKNSSIELMKSKLSYITAMITTMNFYT